MNWKILIERLIDAGLTQTLIAKACDCSQATVSEIARGVSDDPRSSIGDALRALCRINAIDITDLESAKT